MPKEYYCGTCGKLFTRDGDGDPSFTDSINGKKAWFCTEKCALEHFFKHALESVREFDRHRL